MKEKILLIILLIFCITGCSADYDLVITDKKKVYEKVVLLDENDNILKTSDSIDYFLLYKKKQFTSLGYNVENIKKDQQSGFNLSNNYDSLNEFIETSMMKSLFENANIEDDNNLFIFETTGQYLYNNIFTIDILSDYIYNLDEIKVKIKFYNKVIKHNADYADEKNNVYTWILSKENNYDNIMFQLSNDVRYDIKYADYLNRNKIVFIIIGIVIVLIIFTFLQLKKIIKRNNSI